MIKITSIILLLAFVNISCSPLGNDTNTLIKESSNNRSNKKAILFLKEAALSEDSYQVTIMDNRDTLKENEVGNTFIVDSGHDSSNLNKNSIIFFWVDDSTLQIDYN